MTLVDDDQIAETLVIHAAPERVYRALTDPEELVAWWGDPDMYWCTSWTLDLRIGGRWKSEGTNRQGGTFSVEGEFTELDPPRVVGFTWKPSWIESTTRIRVVLTAIEGGTHVEWTQSGFAGNQRAIADHKGGLPSVLTWLKRYAERAGRVGMEWRV
jgi:uncharacterized protein YndB with AHSA1/START domain